VEVLSEFVT